MKFGRIVNKRHQFSKSKFVLAAIWGKTLPLSGRYEK